MFRFLTRVCRVRAGFAAACDGNVALLFWLALPVLIGTAGLGIDSAAVYNQRSRMQSVADSTALAVGKEMGLSLENLDPMGVHTGDSITVAPAMTLTDREYQVMRDAAVAIIREVGVDAGGCNIQFAINPRDGGVVNLNSRRA